MPPRAADAGPQALLAELLKSANDGDDVFDSVRQYVHEHAPEDVSKQPPVRCVAVAALTPPPLSFCCSPANKNLLCGGAGDQPCRAPGCATCARWTAGVIGGARSLC
eukprot:6100421-Prymnesium_polylepis.1